LIGAGIIAATVAGLLVFFLSSANSSNNAVATPVAAVTATPIPVEQIVIAARDLPNRTIITARDVLTREYPVGLAPVDAVKSITDVLSSTLTTGVFSGEVILQRQFQQAQLRTGASLSLPQGKVLVAFPATDLIQSTGAIQPGDKIDILLTLPISGTVPLGTSGDVAEQTAAQEKQRVVQATMQDIEVYSTGVYTPPSGPNPNVAGAPSNTQGDQGNGEAIKVFSFVVDHQEALILKFIKDSGGTIDMIPRSAKDTGPIATDPVSIDYLVDLYHFAALPGGR
jgi:pilus assembly protein CpaB